MNPKFPEQLAERLRHPLPGWAAQARYAPDLSYGRQAGPPASDARGAAVLMLLYPHQDQWYLPLTLRPAHMASHADQVSLPGGLIEYGESSRHAALREFAEELGPAGEIELLGRLSDFYVFVTNFRVTPWVGVTDSRPEFVPNPEEVAEVLEVPLAHLLRPEVTGTFEYESHGATFTAPYFSWQHHRIWGATSMMLSELVEVVRELELS